MEKESKKSTMDRRQFIRNSIIVGSAFYILPGKLFASKDYSRHSSSLNQTTDFDYKYRTVSVDHVHEIGGWIEKLKSDNKLSTNETYRKYLGNFVFDPEKILPGAKSLVILSIPQNIISTTFHLKGKTLEVKTPTGYFSDNISGQDVKDRVAKEIIKDSSKKLQGGPRLPLKTLAVRSGLAEYGRNNITFVNGGYGSFHRLVGFYTDSILEDNWGPLKMMQLCKGCSICIKRCPNKCITEKNFVIDAGKCISLYNELPDPMPTWIDPKVHNALAGCFYCQDTCPANADAIKRVEKIGDLNEAETELILNLGTDKAIQQLVLKKLDRFLSSADDIPYLSRNLKLVLANTQPK